MVLTIEQPVASAIIHNYLGLSVGFSVIAARSRRQNRREGFNLNTFVGEYEKVPQFVFCTEYFGAFFFLLFSNHL